MVFQGKPPLELYCDIKSNESEIQRKRKYKVKREKRRGSKEVTLKETRRVQDKFNHKKEKKNLMDMVADKFIFFLSHEILLVMIPL